MRGIALVATIVAGSACAPEAAGVVVRAVPEGVGGARYLDVYIGRGERPVPRVRRPEARRHDDDGRAMLHRLDVGAFDAPTDIWLVDGEPGQPIWIAVRALREDGSVAGEGGFPRAVVEPADRVERAEVVVRPGTIEGVRGCPGFYGDDGLAHYIVPEPNDADCDRDDAVGAADCDDFDREVRPGAIDTVCDGVDLDCNPGSPTIEAPCAMVQDGACRAGAVICDDESGGIDDCIVDPILPPALPELACDSCANLAGEELVDCLRPLAHVVQCEIEYLPTADGGFCQDTGTQLDRKIWYEDQGPIVPSAGTHAEWLPRVVPGVDYGWVGSAGFASGLSLEWPPSPAVAVPLLPIRIGERRDEMIVVSRDPNGVLGVTVVEIDFRPDDDCDLDGPDCSEPFPP